MKYLKIISLVLRRLLSNFENDAISCFSKYLYIRLSKSLNNYKEELLFPDLYLIDAIHGGFPFWDWILLIEGGLWSKYFSPAIIRHIIDRSTIAGIKSVLEIDGFTFEKMKTDQPLYFDDLQKNLLQGNIEIVNGTYAQPFLQIIGDESCLRQFYEGNESILSNFNLPVTSYACQEPSYCIQLPQILKGFGYTQVLLRTHWAAFGSDPQKDLNLIKWVGPDNTSINTIPKYSCMNYSRLKKDSKHKGIINGGLSPSIFKSFTKKEIEGFYLKCQQKKISLPLLSQFVDIFESPSCINNIKNIRTITIGNYVNLLNNLPLKECYFKQDDLCQTLPWGLHGNILLRIWSETENELILAEQADARSWWKSGISSEKTLRTAWKKLLLSQHHDMLICGMWYSTRYAKPLESIAIELCINAKKEINHLVEKQTEEYQNNCAKKVNCDNIEVNINNDGTYTIIQNNKVIIQNGGAISVWQNDRFYDSRNRIISIEQKENNSWDVFGYLGNFYFHEVFTYTNYFRVSLQINFGDNQYFGPQNKEEGYYVNDEQKMCIVFPIENSIVVRNTPFFYETTNSEHFASNSWVGIENKNKSNYAIINQEPAGFSLDKAKKNLLRVLAWSPRTWLYDSDNSFSRNGSKYTTINGIHDFSYILKPYMNRADAAKFAHEVSIPQLCWPKIISDEVVLSSFFIHENEFFIRLWNPTNHRIQVSFDFGDPVLLFFVDYRFSNRQKIKEIILDPWKIQTILVQKLQTK